MKLLLFIIQQINSGDSKNPNRCAYDTLFITLLLSKRFGTLTE